MINLSIKPSTVPSVWKIEKITPVFKSGDLTKPENHRPISELPIASKILEKDSSQQSHNIPRKPKSAY